MLDVEPESAHDTVYNFEVEETHTYYVGDASTLVHNQKVCGGGGGGGPPPPSDKAWNKAQASGFGYTNRIPPQKSPFNSHGQEVYSNGNGYITRDWDSHSGGTWKMYDKKGNRIGTYDSNLNKIGP